MPYTLPLYTIGFASNLAVSQQKKNEKMFFTCYTIAFCWGIGKRRILVYV